LRESGLLSRYSKNETVAFSREDRRARAEAVIARHGAEIARGRAWLDRAIAAHPVLAGAAPFIARIEPATA
jgi:glutathione S-transferase